MLPGYLHFDVRRGLKADLLNASMAALLPDHSCIRKALDSFGLADICFKVTAKSLKGINGHQLHFFIKDRAINQSELVSADALSLTNDIFLQSCLSGQAVSLEKLRQFLLKKKAKPTILAVAVKILDHLKTKVFNEPHLNGNDALWLICHLVTLCAQLDALDPKFVTSSKVCLGEKAVSYEQPLSLENQVWLNQVLINVPTINEDRRLAMDVLAVSFIKSLVSMFGARGDSTILEVGMGISDNNADDLAMVEAIWCEASLPVSINECGPSNSFRLKSLYEITGLVPANSDMSALSLNLSLHGATATSFHLVYGEKNQTFYQMRFLCSDEDKRDAIEAFLIKGHAYDAVAKVVERHELNRRVVSIPIGTGNKSTAIRFYEYIYYDKTVRVEPLKEDLDQYVQKTDYSVDVARSDLLFAWKKWRGRMVADNS